MEFGIEKCEVLVENKWKPCEIEFDEKKWIRTLTAMPAKNILKDLNWTSKYRMKQIKTLEKIK